MVSEILGFLLNKGGMAPGSPRLVALDVSQHKEQEYIWLRGWGSEGFLRY